MKKQTWKQILLLLMSFSLVLLMAGCGKANVEEAEPGNETAEVSSQEAAEEASEVMTLEETEETMPIEDGQKETAEEFVLVFETKDLTIAMDAEAEPILAALGEWDDYFEYTGCAGLGLMKYYYFTGFELGTYQDANGEDHIYSISFTNDLSETKEGLCIGDSWDRAISLYADLGEVEDMVIMITTANTTLTILNEDGSVSSIQYLSRAASALYQ